MVILYILVYFRYVHIGLYDRVHPARVWLDGGAGNWSFGDWCSMYRFTERGLWMDGGEVS